MAKPATTAEHQRMNDDRIRGFPPGVQSMDHAADVGLRIHATDLPALLDLAARGMVVLLAGEEGAEDAKETDTRFAELRRHEANVHQSQSPAGQSAERQSPAGPSAEHRSPAGQSAERPSGAAEPAFQPEHRDVTVGAADTAQLLADWLRELLYLYEVHRLEYAGAEFIELNETDMHATISLRAAAESSAREIKGVTYHGLEATRRPDGWHATVIFDV